MYSLSVKLNETYCGLAVLGWIVMALTNAVRRLFSKSCKKLKKLLYGTGVVESDCTVIGNSYTPLIDLTGVSCERAFCGLLGATAFGEVGAFELPAKPPKVDDGKVTELKVIPWLRAILTISSTVCA